MIQRIARYLIPTLLVSASVLAVLHLLDLGYWPHDDALMHAAKVVSAKDWSEIVVMREGFSIDPHHGWHAVLSLFHHAFGIGEYGLVTAAVALCFVAFATLPMFFVRRSESWLIALSVAALASPRFHYRLPMGRPHLVIAALFACVLLTWERLQEKRMPWPYVAGLCACLTAMSWLVPTSSYVFGVAVVCLLLAGQWRAGARLAVCMAASTGMGFVLTGHPVAALRDSMSLLTTVPAQGTPLYMRAAEIWPAVQTFGPVVLAALLYMWGTTRRPEGVAASDRPAVAGVILGLVLGTVVGRLWYDWGMVALIVWGAHEVSRLLVDRMDRYSLQRVLLCGVVTVASAATLSADVDGRWSMKQRRDLSYENLSEEARAWYPDSGGIMYSSHTGLFYEMFFQNPKAPWRYATFFEPTLMRPENLEAFRKTQEEDHVPMSYRLWVERLKPADRLFAYSVNPHVPPFDQLEWSTRSRDRLSIGRLPHATANSTGQATPDSTSEASD